MNRAADVVREIADGIFRIDVLYPVPQHTCCYIIIDNGKAAIIDCGAKKGIPNIIAALQAQAVTADDVEWIIPTHAHLDHAGAAGQLMQHYPRATLAAHPDTVKHLCAPHTALVAATRTLYGEQFFGEQYGEIIAVDRARAHPLTDGEYLMLAEKRPLQAVWTPGHAWHHLSVYDQHAAFIAAGDAYGVSHKELNADGEIPRINPVMPPSQFNPEAMANSIRLLRRLNARLVGLAHFDAVADSDNLSEQQLTALATWTTHARQLFAEKPDSFRRAMYDYLLDWMVSRVSVTTVEEVRQKHQAEANLSALGYEYWLNKEQARVH